VPRHHPRHPVAREPARHRRPGGRRRVGGAEPDQPGPAPVPRRPGVRAPVDGREGLLPVPARQHPGHHAPGLAAARSARVGAVRRHPPRRPRVRSGLTPRSGPASPAINRQTQKKNSKKFLKLMQFYQMMKRKRGTILMDM